MWYVFFSLDDLNGNLNADNASGNRQPPSQRTLSSSNVQDFFAVRVSLTILQSFSNAVFKEKTILCNCNIQITIVHIKKLNFLAWNLMQLWKARVQKH